MVMYMSNSDNVSVERLTNASVSAVDDLVVLGRELHQDERSTTLSELEAIVHDKNIILMVVRDTDRIIGMATLYVIQKIGRRNGLLEDVIVSAQYRGQGLGERLMRVIIDMAKENSVGSITLTSRSIRVAAHKLYEKLGFKKRETDVFKLVL